MKALELWMHTVLTALWMQHLSEHDAALILKYIGKCTGS